MMFINPYIGRVTATKLITLHPMETRTVTGFVRKIKNTDATITEALEDEHSHSVIVCPRVVTVNNAGRNARIPVRICNVTARPIKIKARQSLCQLNEVHVLREAPVFEPLTAAIQTKTATEKKRKAEDGNIKDQYGVNLEQTDLTDDEKNQVYKLFQKYDAICTKHPPDLGHTSTVKLSIKLNNNTPFKEPY
ncbi:hypothetical protein DPMN_106458 [Dreissena polymorpha]|uniref:Uncharacterized protein n=1 Tax=Dreissena polymorpha TaxID=45954 RepID=A0A9D4K580_DREPO|nr:hypothetical protein DPMN_106458 [Dreissena polymorpha]